MSTRKSGENKRPAYRDPSLPVEQRVEDLLGRMTVEEKVAQTRCDWSMFYHEKTGGTVDITDSLKGAIGETGLGALYAFLRADWFSGMTLERGLNRRQGAEAVNALQRYLLEHTRLGIPALVMEECNHGLQCIGATVFPSEIGMGSTWNPALNERAARAMALEMRSEGVTVGFGPDLDLTRDPRWSRVEENYGEDPYHVAKMGRGMVRGLQGERLDTDHTVVSALRAFPGYAEAEGGHNNNTVHAGAREMHEAIMRPHREAFEEGSQGTMIALLDFDGMPAYCDGRLLTDTLRTTWGFEGFTFSDGDNLNSLIGGWRVAADQVEAGAMALKAGVDMCLGDDLVDGKRTVFGRLGEALKRGLIEIEDLDRAVRRILRIKFILGLFERPYVDPDRAEATARTDEHLRLTLQAARESIILLKNEAGLLPLDKKLPSVAVIGPNADDAITQIGDYSPTIDPGEVTTILDGIRAAVSERASVRYARGCGIRDASKEGFAEAVEAVRGAEVAVVVVGGSSKGDYPAEVHTRGRRSVDSECGEGQDRATLGLMGPQSELLSELKETGTQLVVVLIHGRPMTINWIAEHADAVVDAWYPGQCGGTAVAEVLFGDYNPAGRLPVSVPKHVGQLPVYYYSKRPRRNTYTDMDSEPLYPFGFGLSYTTFEYRDLSVTPQSVPIGATAEVSVLVTNTGAVAGDEVVQLYLRDEVSSTSRPYKELRGFRRIHLAPGETKEVSFSLGEQELCFYGPDMEWIVEPGEFTVMVGGSSTDLVSAKFVVTGTSGVSA